MTETMQQMFFLKKNAVAIIGVDTYLCPKGLHLHTSTCIHDFCGI